MSILEDETKRVDLNVGGEIFVTSVETLQAVEGSKLTTSFQPGWKQHRNASGQIFINRSGEIFAYVLEYLRAQQQGRPYILPSSLTSHKLEKLRIEADFYGLYELAQQTESGPSVSLMGFLKAAARSPFSSACDELKKLSLAKADPKGSTQGQDAKSAHDEKPLEPEPATTVQHFLEQVGGVAEVVSALGSPVASVQEDAAGAMWYLSRDLDVQRQMFNSGAIAKLLRLAQSPSIGVLENAVGALKTIASNEVLKEEMISLGGVAVLKSALSTSSAMAREHASAALDLLGTSAIRAASKDYAIPANTTMNQSMLDEQKPVADFLEGISLCWKQHCAGVKSKYGTSSPSWIQRISNRGIMDQLAEMLQSPAQQVFALECLLSVAKAAKDDDALLVFSSSVNKELSKILCGIPITLQTAAANALAASQIGWAPFDVREEMVQSLEEAGILKALLPLLKSHDQKLRTAAAAAVINVSGAYGPTDEQAQHLIEHGAHLQLFELLSSGMRLQWPACRFLAYLLPRTDAAFWTGAAAQLVTNLHSESAGIQQPSCTVLDMVCAQDGHGAHFAHLALQTTDVTGLVAQLTSASRGTQRSAATAIKALTACQAFADAFIRAGAPEAAMKLAASADPSLQELAATILGRMMKNATFKPAPCSGSDSDGSLVMVKQPDVMSLDGSEDDDDDMDDDEDDDDEDDDTSDDDEDSDESDGMSEDDDKFRIRYEASDDDGSVCSQFSQSSDTKTLPQPEVAWVPEGLKTLIMLSSSADEDIKAAAAEALDGIFGLRYIGKLDIFRSPVVLQTINWPAVLKEMLASKHEAAKAAACHLARELMDRSAVSMHPLDGEFELTEFMPQMAGFLMNGSAMAKLDAMIAIQHSAGNSWTNDLKAVEDASRRDHLLLQLLTEANIKPAFLQAVSAYPEASMAVARVIGQLGDYIPAAEA